MRAQTLPGMQVNTWTIRRRGDKAAAALADRHYSRRTKGAAMFCPPGKALVLETPCERAVWVTSYSQFPKDGLDAWRCTIFRNEGAGLSSSLIIDAMAMTSDRWGACPADGWVTWIRPDAVLSPNPGYCFLRAGWWRDRTWSHPRLIRLRACA